MFLRVLNFVRPYRWLIISAIASLIIFTNSGLFLPWILKIIIDKVLGTSNLGLLYTLLTLIILIYIVREIFFYISHYLTYYVAQRIIFDIRTKLFKHLQSLSLHFYEEYRTGKLISNILTDVAMLQQMVSASLITVVVNVFVIIFITCMLFIMNTRLALVCFILIPLQFLNFTYFKKHIIEGTKQIRERMSEISANLAETLNGVKVVKSFAAERSESRNFIATLRPTFSMVIDVNMKSVYCWIIAEIISVGCLVGVIAYGGILVSRNEMTIGSFVAFYAYLGMLITPITQLSTLSTVISQGITGAARIFKLLDTVPEIKDTPNAIKIKSLTGAIEFENVSFSYDSGQNIIENFSLSIKPGAKVAFVGKSGSGKSTIASLLLRFYDVTKGAIKVDGINIKKLHSESYRKHIGLVLQEPFLFSGTIEENIRYGKKDATTEEIIEAAKKANIHDFIESLEDGYQTKLGENGENLSGGQKQRIAIARAILKNPSILILDEATSALDTISERIVQKALDNLMQDRTTIIIAHRLSTVQNADMIVVMDKGKIIQKGSHTELMQRDGHYKDLYMEQIIPFEYRRDDTVAHSDNSQFTVAGAS